MLPRGSRVIGIIQDRFPGWICFVIHRVISGKYITNHDTPVHEGWYRDLTDDILGDLTSQHLYNKKRRISYDLDETMISPCEILTRISLYTKIGRDLSPTPPVFLIRVFLCCLLLFYIPPQISVCFACCNLSYSMCFFTFELFFFLPVNIQHAPIPCWSFIPERYKLCGHKNTT